MVDVTETNDGVLASGSGSLNLADLTVVGSFSAMTAALKPADGWAFLGPTSIVYNNSYSVGISGPTSFGSSSTEFRPDSGTGDIFGIRPDFSGDDFLLFVPPSGATNLTSSSFYDGETFVSMGLTTGTFIWSWGEGVNADSFTLNVGVPEPQSLAMMMLLTAIGLGRTRKNTA